LEDLKRRVADAEETLGQIGQSGLTSPKMGTRLLTVWGYSLLISLIGGAIYLLLAFIFGILISL